MVEETVHDSIGIFVAVLQGLQEDTGREGGREGGHGKTYDTHCKEQENKTGMRKGVGVGGEGEFEQANNKNPNQADK